MFNRNKNRLNKSLENKSSRASFLKFDERIMEIDEQIRYHFYIYDTTQSKEDLQAIYDLQKQRNKRITEAQAERELEDQKRREQRIESRRQQEASQLIKESYRPSDLLTKKQAKAQEKHHNKANKAIRKSQRKT